jgi:hypothetical protein
MIEGSVTAVKRDDGTVRLSVKPGMLKISFGLLVQAAQADPEWLGIRDGLVIFRGVEDDGRQQVLVYRPTGVEQGPEGGWLVCDPVG